MTNFNLINWHFFFTGKWRAHSCLWLWKLSRLNSPSFNRSVYIFDNQTEVFMWRISDQLQKARNRLTRLAFLHINTVRRGVGQPRLYKNRHSAYRNKHELSTNFSCISISDHPGALLWWWDLRGQDQEGQCKVLNTFEMPGSVHKMLYILCWHFFMRVKDLNGYEKLGRILFRNNND